MPYNANGPKINRKQWLKCVFLEGHDWEWEGMTKVCEKCNDRRSNPEPPIA